MSKQFAIHESIENAIQAPDVGILSKVLFSDDAVRVTLFGFAPGEEMTDHTTTMEAILHFLEGEAELKLGDETFTVRGGAWIQMNPNLVHGITAKTAVKMLLVLMRQSKA